jgi:restriction system protein
MAIPDFQSLMLPLLQFLGDGQERRAAEAIDALARKFGLTPEETAEMLPSGRAPKFANRVHWARMFLKAAGLVENPRRGVFRITDAGRKEFEAPPPRIDIAYLRKYPAFREWRERSEAGSAGDNDEGLVATEVTPQEQMEVAAAQLRASLAAELLDRLAACDPGFFERIVVQLLLRMGYGGPQGNAGQVVGRAGDGGIDGVIAEDRLGLDSIYLQAKRWEAPVGASQIRDFLGAMVSVGANKGVFITTSKFAEPARRAAAASPQHRIVLIDGDRLAQLMIDHDLGVAPTATFVVKRVDSDFFSDE